MADEFLSRQGYTRVNCIRNELPFSSAVGALRVVSKILKKRRIQQDFSFLSPNLRRYNIQMECSFFNFLPCVVFNAMHYYIVLKCDEKSNSQTISITILNYLPNCCLSGPRLAVLDAFAGNEARRDMSSASNFKRFHSTRTGPLPGTGNLEQRSMSPLRGQCVSEDIINQ